MPTIRYGPVSLNRVNSDLNNHMINFRSYGRLYYLTYAMNLMIYDTILIKAGVKKTGGPFEKRIATLKGTISLLRNSIGPVREYFDGQKLAPPSSRFSDVDFAFNFCKYIDYEATQATEENCLSLGGGILAQGMISFSSWAADFSLSLANRLDQSTAETALQILREKEYLEFEYIFCKLLNKSFDKFSETYLSSVQIFGVVKTGKLWEFAYWMQFTLVFVTLCLLLQVCIQIARTFRTCLNSIKCLLIDSASHNSSLKVELTRFFK